jgi:predicted nucleic acid-binding Zn ribbon protein
MAGGARFEGEDAQGRRPRMGRVGGRARRVIPPGAKVIGKGKPRGGDPAALAALVSRAYPSREPEDIAALRAFTWWARAVPPRVAKNARPVRVHGGVLTVHAATSAWVSDLSFLQAQILESIQKFAPGARIREIRVKVGPLPPIPPPPERRSDATPPPAPRDIQLPSDIASALAQIGDDQLREVLADAARATLAPPVPRRIRKRSAP